MSTQTYTVAQALQTTASGIIVTDSPANIAAVVGNNGLVSRVSQFNMLGNDVVTAAQAEALSTLGSQFTRGSYSLTVRDSVAALTNPANTAGLPVGSQVQVVDTVDNLLGAVNNPIIRAANTLTVTTNSTLTVAQLLTFETWPHFDATGTTIVLADSAANLLSVTPAEALPQVKVFAVCVNSTVSAADAIRLVALSGFWLSAGVTVTVADTLTSISSFVAAHASIATLSGVALRVADSVANLTGGVSALNSLLKTYPALTVTLAANETVAASQLAGLLSVPHFAGGSGHALTVSDTLANLLALTAAQAALVQAAHLSASASTNAAQLQQLAQLPGFSAGSGNQLLVTDTVAHLANLSAAQAALATGITAADSVGALVGAWSSNLPAAAHITGATAQLDAGSYSMAQLAPLGSLAAQDQLTLVPNGGAASLHVVDTLQDLASGAAELAALRQAGTVTVTPTDDHSIMSAAAAATLATTPGFDPSAYTLAVSDIGTAITGVADSIFQHGFQSITITAGTFTGPAAELLDPTLHLAAGAAAQLGSSASVNAATLTELAALPGFSLAPGAALTVQDSVAGLTADQAVVAGYASAVRVTDTATVTAAVAEQLASLRNAVGASHFSFGGNFLVISDSATHLLDPANSAGVALGDSISLSSDSRVSADQAAQLLALGAKFWPGDAAVIIADTGNALANLISDPTAATTLNAWNCLVMLSADSTLSVADATALTAINGFTPGLHHLILSDTAQDLLQAGAPVMAAAYAVELSQPATLSVADAEALTGPRGLALDAIPLTIADTPAALAAMPPALAAVAAGETLVAPTPDNADGFIINASQLAQLLALPNFDASSFSGQIVLADTATILQADTATLNSLPAGLAGQVEPSLSADAVVSVSQAEALCALNGFSLGGHTLTISDTALNIATLDAATRAMATDVRVTGGGNASYTATDFLALTEASNFAGMAPVPVSDSALALQALVTLDPAELSHISSITITSGPSISAAEAEALSTLPNLLSGASVSIADSVDALLQATGTLPDNWAGELLANRITLTNDAVINAAQAQQLAQLGYRLDNGGHNLMLRDTPDALLAAVDFIGPIAGQISETVLPDNASPWVVSIAQAEQLAMLPNFQVDAAHGIIADNPADLLAPINAAMVAAAPSVTLDDNTTVSVQTAQALHALTNFSLGTHDGGTANQLTISDGAGHLATLDPGTAALATAIQLQGNSVASVAQFDAIRALPNYSDNGKLLLVSDSATKLLTLVGSDVHLASAIMLAPDPSDSGLSADQAQQIASLPGFTPGIAQIGVLDSAADLLKITGTGSTPDDWIGELAAGGVTLSQDGTVTAAQAAELALLGSRFHLGTHTLTVSDSATQLVAAANASGLGLASHIQLADDETLSAADATRLADIAGLSKADHSVTVADSAADLAFPGYAAGVALADAVQLNTATSLSVSAAEALIGMSNFQANPAAPLTISDSLANLLGLASAHLANNDTVLQSTPIALSGDTVATVAQMTALAALPEAAQFSLAGHTLTVTDSGKHLSSFAPAGPVQPSAYVMTGDATLTAAQADTLAHLGVNLDGNTLTIADSPTALLDSANTDGMQLANALALSANVTVDAATAEALEGTPNFSTGGHLLTVRDSAQALLNLDSATQQMAGSLILNNSETVDASTLAGLTRLGIKFSLNGQNLQVGDTAAHLVGLNSMETALTSAQVLTTDAAVSAAVAAQLLALPDFSVESGVSLTIQDSIANLNALSPAVQAMATAETLLPGIDITITAADAAALATLPHFSNAGAVITVDDTIAALTNPDTAAWQSVDTAYLVTDSISNLVAHASAPLLTNANGVQLLGDAQADAGTLGTLAAIPGFRSDSASLTIVDEPTAIAAHAAQIAAFATAAQVEASGTVSAADAEALAGLQDRGLLSFASGAHLTVKDSYAALASPDNADGLALASGVTVLDDIGPLLAAMQADWGTKSPSFELAADGSMNGTDAAIISAADGRFSLNGHSLTVQDDADGATANAETLASLGLSVTVTDTAADVAAHSAALIGLGNTLVAVSLSDTAPIAAASAAALNGLAEKLGGSLVSVSDTAVAVDDSLNGLKALSSHLASVQVTGLASDVSAVAPDLEGLGSLLTVHLTDSLPVDSSVIANLYPILDSLAAGTHIDVSDTATMLWGRASLLSLMDSVIGTLTISTGNTVDAGTAAVLAPLDQHLGAGVQLLVNDTAADIASWVLGLAQLQHDGHLGSVTVTATMTTAELAGYGTDLASLGAQVTISDNAASVSSSLDELQGFKDAGGTIAGISLTDLGTPTITVKIGQIAADAGVLAALPYHLTVLDSPDAIEADLSLGIDSQLVIHDPQIDSISLDQGSFVMLSTSEITEPALADVLTKLPPSSVIVGPVAVNDIDSVLLSGGGQISSIGVVDDATTIQSDLTSGTHILNNLGSIASITANSGDISLSMAQVGATGVDDTPASALAKLNETTLTVTGAAISDIAALMDLAHTPDHIAFQDTAGTIGSELASGPPDLQSVVGRITSITVSDPTNAVALTGAEASAVLDLLGKVVGTVAVSAVDLASLPTIAALAGPALQIAVSDTASHIESGVTSTPDLVRYASLLTDVHATDGLISLTAQQALQDGVDNTDASALAHLSTGLTVTQALVGDLAQLAELKTLPNGIDISDSAGNIQDDLTSGTSHLLNSSIMLNSVAISDNGIVTLTDAEANTAADVLPLVSDGSLHVTDVPVADIATLATLSGASTTLYVVDNASTVEDASVAGQAIAANKAYIGSVAVSDGTLDAATAAAVYNDLQALGISFDESNLTISDTAAALLNAESTSPAVLSAAHAITLASDALNLTASAATALLAMLGNDLGGHQLTLSDSAEHLLDPANSQAVMAANSVALDSIAPVSAQVATQLVGLTNFSAGAVPITVADTPANLLDQTYATGIHAATTVMPNAACTVSADTLGQLEAIAGFTNGGHQITMRDTIANLFAASPDLLDHANRIDVADTASDVVANLDALQADLLGHSLTVSVSDAEANTPAISISATTYSIDQAVIDSIDTAGIVSVTGTAAQLAALANTLHNDVVVGRVNVQDDPTSILLNLPALESIGAKFTGATVTGATVSAAAVAQLMTIPNLSAGSLIVSDSGSQIAAAIAANGQAGVDFLNNQSVRLNQNSVTTAADALALESIRTLNKDLYTLSVWDSATHLTDNFDHYLTAVSSGIIDQVYLRTIGGAATVTANTAATLFSIPHFNKSNPDGSPNVLTVQDTAAHIGSAYAVLNNGMIDHVVVSSSATVTDALFNELLSLGATKTAGVAITVRDSATAIINGAPSQTAGSITPAAWMLSGSASVDEAGLAYLGGLAGFSAGAYTLTLSQDATVSVTDANAIALLGSSFLLGTHHLYLPGSIADMASLSAAAQGIVVPQITDTFSNIAQLSPNSGLLGGTIIVSDSEPVVTVSQAADFLALLKVGSNPGIPAANVNFAGNVETVTDTLGNIQMLVGTPAWIQNADVHSDFHLVVADTVANLSNPANLAALSAMAGTTLSGNQTALAADAEALFAVKDAINFNLDGHTLTVQDSAANLLDPANLDAVGMASVVALSASYTVSAADAETLLSWGNFQISDGTMLTISDSSDALLDGVLLSAISNSDYASNLQVELAGPEVLDAQTAQLLVSLAHFVDTGDLSIQDSASYLLNPNNHAAEQDAIGVTLAGDETVSAATAVHLAGVPHFDLGGFTLHLATDDYADAVTLKTIADFGSGFDPNGHTLTMTQDTINLTPAEYTAAQADGLVTNGHALSAIPVDVSATASGNTLTVDGTGVGDATVTLYDATGHVLTTATAGPGFEVSAADPGQGENAVLTETVGGNAATGESAPVVFLEQSLLEGLVSINSASFATTGGANSVQVGANEYLTLYDAASAPGNPATPDLVYDATQHVLLLEMGLHAPVPLVTLGGIATTPVHLDISEIMIKHQIG